MKALFKAGVVALAIASAAVPTLAEAQSRRDRDDRREDRRDRREDRWDRREDRHDRREDRRDRRHDGGPGSWDRREDRWDRREDRWDRREDRWDRREDRWDRRDGWWRGRSEFRDYRGRRNGYYFAPGYGYYRVAPTYYGYGWRRGHTVPHAYRRYVVHDPYFYNLRPAPRGHQWIYLDNDLVLIGITSGVIADIVFDVF